MASKGKKISVGAPTSNPSSSNVVGPNLGGANKYSIAETITSNVPSNDRTLNNNNSTSNGGSTSSSSILTKNDSFNRYGVGGPDDDLRKSTNRIAQNSDSNNGWLDMIIGNLVSPNSKFNNNKMLPSVGALSSLSNAGTNNNVSGDSNNSSSPSNFIIKTAEPEKISPNRNGLIASNPYANSTIAVSRASTFETRQRERDAIRDSERGKEIPKTNDTTSTRDVTSTATVSIIDDAPPIQLFPIETSDRSLRNSLEKVPSSRSIGSLGSMKNPNVDKSPSSIAASYTSSNNNIKLDSPHRTEVARKLYIEAYDQSINEIRLLKGSLESSPRSNRPSLDSLDAAVSKSSSKSHVSKSIESNSRGVPEIVYIQPPKSNYINAGLISQLDDKAKDTLSSIDFSSIVQSNYYAEGVKACNIDESSLLTRHIVDCIHALRGVLSVKNSNKNEPENLLPMFMYKCLAHDMTKVVTSTLTSPWSDADAILYPEYFDTSEYILNNFPELFAGTTSKSSNMTLLHLATKYSPAQTALKATSMLLNHNKDMVYNKTDKEQLPLHTAMLNKGNTIDSIKLLVKAFPDALFASDSNGFLPLHVALSTTAETVAERTRSCEIIRFLIDSFPASALHACKKGRLPIHLACSYENPETSIINALLLANPASINLPCQKGWLALHRLVAKNSFSIGSLKMLIWGLEGPPINIAPFPPYDPENMNENHNISNINSETLTNISSSIANLNGQTALHIYCESLRIVPEYLSLLIRSFPMAVLSADNHGYLPLHIILDNHVPSPLALNILLFGDVGFKSCRESIAHPENPLFRMYPLHLILATSVDVNIEGCKVIAALYPDAIHIGGGNLESRAMLDHNHHDKEGELNLFFSESWSPYEKAKQRHLPNLISEFDKILSNDAYRIEIIKEYNKNVSSIFSS